MIDHVPLGPNPIPAGGLFGMVSEKDILRLSKLIESDEIKSEVYQERLDEVLAVGRAVDEGAAGLSEAGQTVMNIWDKMDAGTIADIQSNCVKGSNGTTAKRLMKPIAGCASSIGPRRRRRSWAANRNRCGAPCTTAGSPGSVPGWRTTSG